MSSIACCIASWVMIPAAPDRSAGFEASEPGPVEIWSHDLTLPGFPIIAWLTPGVLLGIRPNVLTFAAESGVSFTQRPALAAISEPACAAAAPVPNALVSLGNSRSLDARPSEARKRSTAVDSPMTARPSHH